ncbi:MAG TPA: DUF4253 domain-containing protein [Tepidisphaeraceae bacterium]|nr:DUF4253 domain-containing protein [Tepidisphaeraceae bacterium]
MSMTDLQQQLSEIGIDCSTLDLMASRSRKPFYQLTTQGGDVALDIWRKLRSISAETGCRPVILGPPEEVQHRDFTQSPTPEQVNETLGLSSQIRVPGWFADRHEERLNDFLEYNEGEDPSECFAKEGEWPKNIRPATSLYTTFQGKNRQPHGEIRFALIPTSKGWEVPAYLGFGGWNECPDDAVQCAVFKYWHDRWGSEIVVVTNDVIEAQVKHPVASRADALALANEQYEFCEDIVSQGTGTLSKLAASLLNAPLWFFWWD